jgi:hypothetical protein
MYAIVRRFTPETKGTTLEAIGKLRRHSWGGRPAGHRR